MSRVFVIEPPQVNVESADEFGELVSLFRPNKLLSPMDAETLAGQIIEALEGQDYDTQEDYILIAGKLNVFAVALPAMAIRFGSFKALIYNKRTHTYHPKSLGRWLYSSKWEDRYADQK